MDFRERAYEVFKLFNERWALLTAGSPDDYNTMTIGWGGMGSIWGPPGKSRPVLTVYVSPDRYTHSFLEKNDFFTVCFFPEAYRDDLLLLGRESGRDGDKVARTALTPVALEHGVAFAQAELTFVCRKIYSQPLERERLPQEARAGYYGRLTPHTMFIGEIVDAIE